MKFAAYLWQGGYRLFPLGRSEARSQHKNHAQGKHRSMRHTVRFAAVSAFALVLAACGPAEEPAVDEADVAADDTAGDAAGALPAAGAETPAAEAAPADEASPTPTPTAPATAAPAAAPAATPVAMTPPAAFTQCSVCHAVVPGQNGIDRKSTRLNSSHH